MSLRPASARWFEVIMPRMDSAQTAATLARTGLVQLEETVEHAEAVGLDDLTEGIAEYRDYVRAYGTYWERGTLRPSQRWAPPQALLAQALDRIAAWRKEADVVIEQLQSLESEAAELDFWLPVLRYTERNRLNLALLGATGPVLETRLAVLPLDTELELPRFSLGLSVDRPSGKCVLIVGARSEIRALHHEIRLVKGRLLEWPSWLRGNAPETQQRLSERQARIGPEIKRLYRELDTLYERFILREALGDLVGLEWFATRIGSLPTSGQLAWIRGWSRDPSGRRLTAALEASDTRALVHYPNPPPGLQPPQVLRNPRWVKPFEIFVRGLGTPGHDEVDPSPWVAIVAPLLFGYMFGDVGQGLVLFAAGLWLKRRWPQASLLQAGGLSAMLFGLLFGSVFSLEGFISPVWLHPLEAPLTVLAVPLAVAVVLLTLGQLLNALESTWRGQLWEWWLRDAGLLVLYLGMVWSLLTQRVQPIGWIGLIGSLGGRIWINPSLLGIVGAIGSLLEEGLRLLINTLSFARVGAFALAHAGLSSAIVTLAAGADSGWGFGLVMLLGNLLIISLEALVVSVQTTRLVLFEFFVRFLRAEGRPFHPLRPPPDVIEGESYESKN